MKTHVEFRSDRFPPYDSEEQQVNPDLWGKRLAEYLEQRLPAEGITTRGIGAEDWGWIVFVENDSFDLWVGCGHQHGDDDELLCFIHPDKPMVRRWLRRIDTTDGIERLAEALDRILRADPDVHDLCWREG